MVDVKTPLGRAGKSVQGEGPADRGFAGKGLRGGPRRRRDGEPAGRVS